VCAAGGGASGIGLRLLHVEVGGVEIGTPLPDASLHIEQAPRVWRESTARFERVLLIDRRAALSHVVKQRPAVPGPICARSTGPFAGWCRRRILWGLLGRLIRQLRQLLPAG